MIASHARFSPPVASSFLSLGLPQRVTLFALLFAAEWIPLSDRVHQGRGLGSLFQLAAVSGAFLLGLLHVRFKDSSHRVSNDLQNAPIGWAFLAGHVGAFLGAVYLAFLPLGATPSGSWRYVIAALCCTAAIAAIGLAFCAFVATQSRMAGDAENGVCVGVCLGYGTYRVATCAFLCGGKRPGLESVR